jgi:hypothetical protein
VPRFLNRASTRPLAVLAGASLALSGSLGLGASVAGAAARATTTTTTPPVVSAADTWLIKAIGAAAKVGSVRITATEAKGKTKQAISLLVNGDGEGSGTFIQGGSTIRMELVGPLLYFNAPTKYWAAHSTSQQAQAYGGKWIEVSALDPRFTAFDEFFNPETLVAAVFQGHSVPLKLAKPTATLLNHKVVIVSESVRTNGKKSSGQMWIQSSGTPRPLQIIDKSPGMMTTITFSHYGKAVSISTPPEPINLTQAQAGTANGG